MRIRTLALATSLVLGAAACGGDDGGGADATTPSTGSTEVSETADTVPVSDGATEVTDTVAGEVDPAYAAAVCEVLLQADDPARPSEQFQLVADQLGALTPPDDLAGEQQRIVEAHQELAAAWTSTQVLSIEEWMTPVNELVAVASERSALAPDCDLTTDDTPRTDGLTDASLQFWEAQYAGDVAGVWLTFQVTCADGSTPSSLDPRLQAIDGSPGFYAILAEGPQGPVGAIRPVDADVAFGASRPIEAACG